jgi:hypothetical protein
MDASRDSGNVGTGGHRRTGRDCNRRGADAPGRAGAGGDGRGPGCDGDRYTRDGNADSGCDGHSCRRDGHHYGAAGDIDGDDCAGDGHKRNSRDHEYAAAFDKHAVGDRHSVAGEDSHEYAGGVDSPGRERYASRSDRRAGGLERAGDSAAV